MPEPSVTLLLAHAGHWTLWVLYAIPLIAVLVAIPMASRRERTPEPAADEFDNDQREGSQPDASPETKKDRTDDCQTSKS